jgi:hypothetical protein
MLRNGLLSLMLMTVASCALVFGQEAEQGAITGYVFDTSHALMPNALVTVTSLATNLSRTEKTTAEGIFTFSGLEPGVYRLRVAANGFKNEERSAITVDTGATVRLDFVMQVGTANETITISADAPVVNTESGESSTLISTEQVSELALNGRNFTQFLAIGSGVVSQQSGHQMGTGQEGNPLMAVNGGRITMNKFTFDGTMAMDTGGNRGVDIFPPMEAIGEISIRTSNYSADSGGMGAGNVNVVTKAGTQHFHGDVYEYFRNDKMDARNFFAAERQVLKLNNFGYTIGGPAYIPGRYNSDKSKDFFFWSESWSRRAGPQVDSFTSPALSIFTALVPTAAMKLGDFSAIKTTIKDPTTGKAFPGNIVPASMIDHNGQLLLDTFWPLPNRVGNQNYQVNTHAFTRYREELIRWDHNFSPGVIWTVRYATDHWIQDQTVARPSNTVLPTFPGVLSKPGYSFTTKLTNVLNPTTINLFTFGMAENAITQYPTGGFKPAGYTVPEAFPSNRYNVVPDITMGNSYAGIGINNMLTNTNPVFTFKDDFSMNRGTHTLKTGIEVVYHRKNQNSFDSEQGNLNFNGGATGLSVSDLLLGRAFTYTENDKDPGAEVTAFDSEFYFQDDWKFSPSLTLNLGVRGYVIAGGNGGAAVDGNISNFVPSLFDPSKAPKLNSDGSLVAGTGDPLNGIITPANQKGLDLGPGLKKNNTAWGPRFGFAWAPGSHKTVFRGGYGINYFWGTSTDMNLSTNPPFVNSVSISNTLLSNPMGTNGTLFPAAFAAQDVYNKLPSVQSYSANIQRQLSRGMSVEIGYVGTMGNHLPRSLQLNQGNPASTGNVNLRRPYIGLGSITYLENSAISRYNSLQTRFNRRLSHGLFLQASYTFARALGNPEGMPYDSRNKDLDYGPLNVSRKHAFTFNYIYQVPFFTHHGILGGLFSGWQLSGIVNFGKGLPVNVTQSGDTVNFGGNTGAQRPNEIGNPNQNLGADINQWFNTAAYVKVTGAGVVGNAQFNSTWGPGIANCDTSLLKTFKATERLRIQTGVETFNTFNHTQFESVGNQLGGANFGIVTAARDPRILQLRMKLSY